MKSRHLLTMLLLALMPLAASACDFEAGGLFYSRLSGNTVEVSEVPPGSNRYAGDVQIPEVVRFDGTEYVVTRIGDKSFQGCDITLVSLPSTLTAIGDRAFEFCASLTSLSLPEGLKSIGNHAFQGCGIRSVVIPSTVESIGSIPFSQCGTLLVPEDGHVGSMGLEHVVVAEGNTRYDSRNGCDAIIETATNKLIQGTNNSLIPDGTETIADSAFYCCKRMTELHLPASIKEYGERCFWLCQSVKHVYNYNSVPVELNIPVFLFRSEWELSATLLVPQGSVDAYKNVKPWGSFSEIVVMDPTSINGQQAVVAGEEMHFSADGKRLQAPVRGLNIVRMSDGTTKKVVMK